MESLFLEEYGPDTVLWGALDRVRPLVEVRPRKTGAEVIVKNSSIEGKVREYLEQHPLGLNYQFR